MDFRIEQEELEPEVIVRRTSSIWYASVVLLVVALGISLYIQSLDPAPESFPVATDIRIEEGTTVSQVSEQFAEKGLVRSAFYFYVILESDFTDKFIQAGTYRFESKLSSRELADAITSGTYISPSQSITLPEGFRVADMHLYLPPQYDSYDFEKFMKLEGYLFPDTYFVRYDTTPEEIIDIMRKNFDVRTKTLQESIDASILTLHEIVTLASIVEREGNDAESMGLIAGILLKRLEINMPLQVDATLDYLLGKASHELTDDDLNNDSPYNTYMYRGLPPGPISNPGITALSAVLNPTESSYLYYLTGDDGNFYYANTFDEHKENKARFIK